MEKHSNKKIFFIFLPHRKIHSEIFIFTKKPTKHLNPELLIQNKIV